MTHMRSQPLPVAGLISELLMVPSQSIAKSMQPPLCPGHREAAVIRTVKKGGENQGVHASCDN